MEAFRDLKAWIESQNISDEDVELCVGLTEIIVKRRWIEFEGEIYEQVDGLFIGNPLSQILTECFVGGLEKKHENEGWFPEVWYRFVDDVVAKIKKKNVQKTLNELNKIHPALKFTHEEEEDGKLPFLDIMLIRSGRGLEFDIYRKETDAPLCIPADSHHPMVHKLAVFQSALHRAWTIPLNEERRKKEINYLKNMAIINGYSEDMNNP